MYIEYSLRGFLNILFRHFFKICAIGGIVLIFGFLYISNIKETYNAKASLLIKFGQNSIPDINHRSQKEYSLSSRKEAMQSYIKILQSRDLLIPAVEQIGFQRLYPFTNDDDLDWETQDFVKKHTYSAVDSLLSGGMEVSANLRSNILNINVLNQDPEIAAEFVEVLVNIFIAHQNKIYGSSQIEFVYMQIQTVKKALDISRKEFTEFKKSVGIYDLDAETRLLLAEKSNLSSIAYNAVSRAQEELTELKARESEMRVTYQESSPLLQSIYNRISVLEEVVADREYDLIANETDGGTLSPKLAKIEERIKYLDQYRPEYEQYLQAVAANEENYDYYKKKGDDAQMNEKLRLQNITHISVIESPIIATKPISSRKKLLLIAFIMMGAFLGLGTALAIELLDDHIASIGGITTNIDLPVLASFDKNEKSSVIT